MAFSCRSWSLARLRSSAEKVSQCFNLNLCNFYNTSDCRKRTTVEPYWRGFVFVFVFFFFCKKMYSRFAGRPNKSGRITTRWPYYPGGHKTGFHCQEIAEQLISSSRKFIKCHLVHAHGTYSWPTNTALQSIITELLRKKVFWMDTEAKNIFCIFYATLLTSGVSAQSS